MLTGFCTGKADILPLAVALLLGWTLGCTDRVTAPGGSLGPADIPGSEPEFPDISVEIGVLKALPVDQPVQVQFTVFNLGGSPLLVESIGSNLLTTIQPAAFAVGPGDPEGQAVLGELNCPAPCVADFEQCTVSGSVTLVSNDPDEPILEATLQGSCCPSTLNPPCTGLQEPSLTRCQELCF